MRAARFTLVELMIVVAIVAVLAAIAIPALNEMQLKSKIAEVPVNVAGLEAAQVAYMMTMDISDLGTPFGVSAPSGTMGKTPRAWPAGPNVFTYIGWKPDGDVRATYTVDLVVSASDCFTVVGCANLACAYGTTDVDGDSSRNCALETRDAKGNTVVSLAWLRPGVY